MMRLKNVICEDRRAAIVSSQPTEQEKARQAAALQGVGFLVDGKAVDPSRVVVYQRHHGYIYEME